VQVDNEVAQASWNVDTFDGNGPSKIDLDFRNANIVSIDFQWLGVGMVRFGFIVDGVFWAAHTFFHANLTSGTNVPYMRSADLPIRFELDNTLGASATELRVVCCAIMSEAGYTPTSVAYSTPLIQNTAVAPATSIINTGLSTAVEPNGQVVMVIRLRNTNNRRSLILDAILASIPSAGDIIVQAFIDDGSSVVLAGAGGVYTTIGNGSGSEYAVVNTDRTITWTPTGRQERIGTALVVLTTNNARADFENQLVPVGANVQGVNDVIVITAYKYSAAGNETLAMVANIIEIP
jgi:hypothetical protein